MDSYQYGDEWKSAVDRAGEEWREYCEAVTCLQRFFRTQELECRRAAVSQFRKYIDELSSTDNSKRKPRRSIEAIGRLRAAFLSIGINEGVCIKEAVMRKIGEEEVAIAG